MDNDAGGIEKATEPKSRADILPKRRGRLPVCLGPDLESGHVKPAFIYPKLLAHQSQDAFSLNSLVEGP